MTENNETPQVGDIWQEQDPRHPRFVRVEKIGTGRRNVAIRTVEAYHSDWIRTAGARLTYADADRFHGRRGGYKLHHRPERKLAPLWSGDPPGSEVT